MHAFTHLEVVKERERDKMMMNWKYSAVVALLVIMASPSLTQCNSSFSSSSSSAAVVEGGSGFRPVGMWKAIELQFLKWVEDVKVRVDSEDKKGKVSHPRQKKFIVVDSQGRPGSNFVSIQKAIDSIPMRTNINTVIYIKAGIYREKVWVPRYKKYITMRGEGRQKTMIVWNDTAAGATSTYLSATMAIDAPNFAAYNITFQNSAPAQQPGDVKKQAVALRVGGDYVSFVGCGFLGHQDTLYDQKGKHYFQDCYIEGSIDFIFGNGLSFYKNSELHVCSITPGSLTAQKRAKADSTTGFAFVNCSITGSGVVFLGRAWGRYSRVVYAYTFMSDIIIPQGWYDWGYGRRQETVYYGQYKCYGPGATAIARVPWAHELTYEEVKPFLSLDFINGSTWLPYL